MPKKNELPDIFSGIEDATEKEFDSEPLFRPEERDRGVLSHTDREYLYGLREYSHEQSELNRRQAIRSRTINAIRDFHILWLLLDEREWEKIFDAFDSEELNEDFASIIAFMYLGLDQETPRMEEIIERGVFYGANYDTSGRWSGAANSVEADIDIEYDPDVDALYERFQEGEGDQLTPGEIGALVRAGKLEPDDLEALEEDNSPFPPIYIGQVTKRGVDDE